MDSRKLILFALSLVLLLKVSESFDYREEDLTSKESLWNLHERWRSHHTVSRSLTDKQQRFNVFKGNLKHIHGVNQKDMPYKLRLNKFADMTNHEFMKQYGGSKVSHWRLLHGYRRQTEFSHDNTVLPPSVDWRRKERSLASRTKDFAELVDCNTVNHGCDGGLMEKAFKFIEKIGGLTTENNYPYIAKDGSCNSNKMNAPMLTIDGYEMVPKNNENALMKAVANQPVAIAIDAGGKDLQFYSEGAFTGHCGTELNHGVTLVGYGATLDSTKYWIVKNSWGPEWGENGYIRMLREIEAEGGLCGITLEASYPVKRRSDNEKSTPWSRDEF